MTRPDETWEEWNARMRKSIEGEGGIVEAELDFRAVQEFTHKQLIKQKPASSDASGLMKD